MTDSTDLSDKMKDLTFPLRVNINFALPEEVDVYVKRINDVVCQNGYNEISFRAGSDQLPHITLLMGEVAAGSSLTKLVEGCNEYSRTLMPLTFELSAPYWKAPSLKFLFLDTLPTENFRQLRLELYNSVSNVLTCEFHGGPENPSHITAGYGDSKRIALDHLIRIPRPQSSQTGSLRICLAGARGSCSDVLATCEPGRKG